MTQAQRDANPWAKERGVTGVWSRLFQLVALDLWREVEAKFPEGPLHFAEIGVFYGGVSRLLLHESPRTTVYMIDPWDTPDNDYPGMKKPTGRRSPRDLGKAYRECRRCAKQYGDRANIYKMTSRDALYLWQSSMPLHMVFLDGDHRYSEVLHDCGWLDCLVPGGILAGHDRTMPDVWKAINEFAASQQLTVEALGRRVWRFR